MSNTESADVNAGPLDSTLKAVAAEVARARPKFPDNRHLLAALNEEVGELAKAFLDEEPIASIQKEAIQVACVAIRICEELDSAFWPSRTDPSDGFVDNDFDGDHACEDLKG